MVFSMTTSFSPERLVLRASSKHLSNDEYEFGKMRMLFQICKYVHRIDSILVETEHEGLFMRFSDAACRMYNFSEHVSYLASSWLILCMTLERFVAVAFPLKKELFCRQRNALVVIIVVISVMAYSQVMMTSLSARIHCGRHRLLHGVIHNGIHNDVDWLSRT